MALPAGTIYAKGKPHWFEGFMVKGDTIVHDGKAIDWAYRDLVSWDSRDSGEFGERFDRMVAGESFPINEDYGRDGCFDHVDLFLVYEADDLASLAAAIEAAA